MKHDHPSAVVPGWAGAEIDRQIGEIMADKAFTLRRNIMLSSITVKIFDSGTRLYGEMEVGLRLHGNLGIPYEALHRENVHIAFEDDPIDDQIPTDIVRKRTALAIEAFEIDAYDIEAAGNGVNHVDALLAWHLRAEAPKAIRDACLDGINRCGPLGWDLDIPHGSHVTPETAMKPLLAVRDDEKGRIRSFHLEMNLADHVLWNGGSDEIRMDRSMIPATLVGDLEGRPVSAVIDHPAFAGRTISRVHGRGDDLRLKISGQGRIPLADIMPAAALPPIVGFDGTEAKRLSH